MDRAIREERVLYLIDLAVNAVEGNIATLTPAEIAAGDNGPEPRVDGREVEVLLRALLTAIEPNSAGAWRLPVTIVEEVLTPCLSELHDRAAARARTLRAAGHDGVGQEDAGIWEFELLRALSARLESRRYRLVRRIDDLLDRLDRSLAKADGPSALNLAARRGQADEFLRTVLYHAHWQERALAEVRSLLGSTMLLLLASPPQLVEMPPLQAATTRLERLDDELDRFEETLASLG